MEELNKIQDYFDNFFMQSIRFRDALDVENFEKFDSKMLAMSIQNELKDFMDKSEQKIKLIKEINK